MLVLGSASLLFSIVMTDMNPCSLSDIEFAPNFVMIADLFVFVFVVDQCLYLLFVVSSASDSSLVA